jgi:hypothetical protein
VHTNRQTYREHCDINVLSLRKKNELKDNTSKMKEEKKRRKIIILVKSYTNNQQDATVS